MHYRIQLWQMAQLRKGPMFTSVCTFGQAAEANERGGDVGGDTVEGTNRRLLKACAGERDTARSIAYGVADDRNVEIGSVTRSLTRTSTRMCQVSSASTMPRSATGM
jgi:hypothetical protein